MIRIMRFYWLLTLQNFFPAAPLTDRQLYTRIGIDFICIYMLRSLSIALVKLNQGNQYGLW